MGDDCDSDAIGDRVDRKHRNAIQRYIAPGSCIGAVARINNCDIKTSCKAIGSSGKRFVRF